MARAYDRRIDAIEARAAAIANHDDSAARVAMVRALEGLELAYGSGERIHVDPDAVDVDAELAKLEAAIRKVYTEGA